MGVKVLIAEDDEDIRSVLKRYLETEGYECDEAESLSISRKNSLKERTTCFSSISCFPTVWRWTKFPR